jgi:hypothetical protein
MRPAPRSVTRLAVLLPAAAIAGAVEFAIGAVQLTWLSANESAALAASTAPDEVDRAIRNLESSAHASLVAGGIATLLVVGRFPVRKALPWAPLIVWIPWAGALIGNMVMIGDVSVGLTAYNDADSARRALVNDLLIAPGRSVLLYSAEALMLVLLIWIAVLLRSDDTLDFFKRRDEAAADPTWDVIRASHHKRQQLGDPTPAPAPRDAEPHIIE